MQPSKNFILVLTFFVLFSSNSVAQFAGGAGTLGDPYQVSTAAQLDSVRNHPSAYFAQTANISLSSYSDWIPIESFSGHYNGYGFVIDSMMVGNGSYRGLFNTLTNGATLTDISLTNATISTDAYGREYIGLLAAHATGALIEFCSVEGGISVSGYKSNYIGGLIGYASSSEINNSYFNGSIDISNAGRTGYIGGLAGGMSGTTASNTYIVLNVDITQDPLVQSSSDLNVYTNVGGITGYILGGSISKSYIISVSFSASYHTDAVVGQGSNFTVSDVYWNTETANPLGSSFGTGLTSSQMQSESSFSGFDFTNNWKMDGNSGYPALIERAPFDSGSGTEADPYIISSIMFLNYVRDYPDQHFKLSSDIDLDVSEFNTGEGWEPIGDNQTPFSGSLDGAGFSISNLFINRSSVDYTGLFGVIQSGSVTRLVLNSAEVTGRDGAGILAGVLTDVSLDSVVVSGSVSASSKAGGVAGVVIASDSTGLKQQYLASSVDISTSGNYAGGLFGSVSTSAYTSLTITKAYAAGTISGNEQVGGLAGYLYSADSLSISDSYSVASVSGSEKIGGLIGEAIGSEVYLSRAYVAGTISGTGNTDPFIGTYAMSSESFTFLYWDTDVTGINSSALGTGLEPHEMRKEASFSGFDFSSVWRITENVNYPYLFGVPYESPTAFYFAGGSGTEDDPYLISEAVHLVSVRNNLSSHFLQTADIDLTNYNTWVPLGEVNSGSFTGTYDGNNFKISNLSLGDGNYVGLFREIGSGGTVKRVKLRSANLTNSTRNGNRLGILAGQITGGLITNSSAEGLLTINGFSSDYIGGLVGYAQEGATLSKSSFSGSIQVNPTHIQYIGGLIGYTVNSAVDNSYAKFTTDYNPGKLYYAGGISGYSSGNSITNSFCVTDTLEGSFHVNAALGQKIGSAVSNVYYDLDISGMPQTGYEAAVGKTTAQMQQQSTFSGWDFVNTWAIEEGSGYPFLQDGSTNLLTITGDEGWRMLASPIDGASFETLLDTLWLQGFSGADTEAGAPNLYYWNEATQSFTAPTSFADIPENGEGFLLYVYSDQDYDNTDDGFPKVLKPEGEQYTGTVSKNLSFTDTGDISESGWNLVGNPYGTSIHWDGEGWGKTNIDNVIYVWSDSASAYLTWNGSTGTLPDGRIAAWQGYWVKANSSSPILSTTDSVRHAGATHFKKKPTPTVDLRLSGNGMESSAIVAFDARASVGYDAYDAFKLQSLNTDYISLATVSEDGQVLDIQTLPEDAGTIELPLQIDGSDVSGDLELSWELNAIPDTWSVELVDHISEARTNLSQQQSVNIELQGVQPKQIANTEEKNVLTPISPIRVQTKQKQSPRFSLLITTGTTSASELGNEVPEEFGLDQNYPNPFNPSTVISYQLPASSKVSLKVFDVLGRQVAELVNGQVQAGYHQVTFDAGNLASGMYIYRLQTRNTVITKKLTLIK